jgi:hypothetical protein
VEARAGPDTLATGEAQARELREPGASEREWLVELKRRSRRRRAFSCCWPSLRSAT